MRIWRISDDLPAPVSPIIMKCELSGSRGIRTTLLATVELRCRGEHWAFGPAPVLEHAPPLPVFGNREYRPPAENCRTGDERPIQEVPPVWSWSIQCRMNSGNAARSLTSDPISKCFNTDKPLISHCAKHSIGVLGQGEIHNCKTTDKCCRHRSFPDFLTPCVLDRPIAPSETRKPFSQDS